MKKKISIIITVAFVCLMCAILASCSSVKEKDKIQNTGGNNTGLTGNVINNQNGSDYSIVANNGEYFIIFDDITDYQGNMQQVATIDFPSMKVFKDAVTKGNLTDSQKRIMATTFKKDDNGKILACDFDNLCVPKLPMTGSTTNVSWYGGNNYSFTLEFDDEVFGWYHYLTESDYDELYQRDYLNLFERENITVTSTEKIDDNKVVIYNSTSRGKFKNIRFSLSDGEKKIVVDKTYRLDTNNSELATSSDVPSNINLYCIDGEKRYVIALYGFVEDPTDNWLLNFGIEKFVDVG